MKMISFAEIPHGVIVNTDENFRLRLEAWRPDIIRLSCTLQDWTDAPSDIVNAEAADIPFTIADDGVCFTFSAGSAAVEIRKTTVGWVSQFLRVIPRISALEVVMQPLLDTGVPREACAAKAARLLTRLNVPERLWHLAPSTFSGGEQQRVNIARGFIVDVYAPGDSAAG